MTPMRNVAEFVDAFARFWSAPFVDGLDDLLAEDVMPSSSWGESQ